MNGSGSKLRTPSIDDDWFGISVKTSSDPNCSNGGDGLIILSPHFSITSSVSRWSFLLGSKVVPLISNSPASWFTSSDHSDSSPQGYDNHNRESEFPYGTPPEVQTQMKNTSNLHETPHPL